MLFNSKSTVLSIYFHILLNILSMIYGFEIHFIQSIMPYLAKEVIKSFKVGMRKLDTVKKYGI